MHTRRCTLSGLTSHPARLHDLTFPILSSGLQRFVIVSVVCTTFCRSTLSHSSRLPAVSQSVTSLSPGHAHGCSSTDPLQDIRGYTFTPCACNLAHSAKCLAPVPILSVSLGGGGPLTTLEEPLICTRNL